MMFRVKAQLKKLIDLSERNAKHAYIEYCMALPGYGATFYEIMVIFDDFVINIKILLYVGVKQY